MKLLIAFIFISLQLQQNCIDEFVSKYRLSHTSYPQKIELELFQCLFTDEMVYSDVETYEVLKIFIKDVSYTVLVSGIIGAGAGGDNIHLYSFNRNGKILKRSFVGGNYFYEDFGKNCNVKIINDSLVQVTNSSYSDSDYTEKEEIDYYYINKFIHKEVDKGLIDKRRDFWIASYRIIETKELQKLTINELEIMRNEIFAAHGYIFKTSKWKDYFKDKSWYNPQYVNVNDNLTLIEKINIQNIIEVSISKK